LDTAIGYRFVPTSGESGRRTKSTPSEAQLWTKAPFTNLVDFVQPTGVVDTHEEVAQRRSPRRLVGKGVFAMADGELEGDFATVVV
jgi:hypothetical protein